MHEVNSGAVDRETREKIGDRKHRELKENFRGNWGLLNCRRILYQLSKESLPVKNI